MKVLYVCPFANHAGHPPTAAATETKALAEQGVDVTLLTFDGLMEGVKASVPERSVIKRQNWLVPLRKVQITQWPLRIVEMVSTYSNTSGYDIIHLRDGDPFVWLAPLMSKKGQRWLVSLMGSSLFTIGNAHGFMRSAFDLLANGKMWQGAVKLGLGRGRFRFMTQNIQVEDAYSKWMGGVLEGYLCTIERGAPPVETAMSKEEARVKLGIPLDKMVVLVFGAPHGGKDTECVFKAVKQSNVVLVYAGSSAYSIGVKPGELSQKYNLNGQAVIFDKYIPESDKAMYFGAADVSVLSYTKGFKSTSSMLWESCRFGVPVIASRSNHLQDDVCNNGLGMTFSAEDSDSLVRAITRWQGISETSRRGLSRNCIKYAHDNSLSVWARKVVKEYERLMA